MEDLPVDFTQVSPIPLRKTVLLVNNFVANTVRFLNHFSNTCEEKLTAVSNNISRLEIQLSILEAKLNSIPGLETVTAANPQQPPAQSQAQPQSQSQAQPSAAPPPPADGNGPPPPPAAPAAPAADDGPKVKDDPTYAKYFKLIRMKMPIEGLRLKCSSEGNNPDLLDFPDAPIAAVNDPSIIAGLKGGAAAPAAPAVPAAPAASAAPAAPDAPASTELAVADPAAAPPAEEPAQEIVPVLTVKEDPAFRTYFKMITMRIPMHAIKQKMEMEGVDPSIIDNPDAPSPNQPAAE